MAADDFGGTVSAGGDDRRATGHGLEANIGKGIVARGQDKDIDHTEQCFRMRLVTDKQYIFNDPGLSGQVRYGLAASRLAREPGCLAPGSMPRPLAAGEALFFEFSNIALSLLLWQWSIFCCSYTLGFSRCQLKWRKSNLTSLQFYGQPDYRK